MLLNHQKLKEFLLKLKGVYERNGGRDKQLKTTKFPSVFTSCAMIAQGLVTMEKSVWRPRTEETLTLDHFGNRC